MSLQEMSEKLDKCHQHFCSQIAMIHGGTVNVGLIEAVKVEYNGQKTPLSHLASVISDGSFVSLTVYDPTVAGTIMRQLTTEGFSASTGKAKNHNLPVIRVTIPNCADALKGRNREKIQQLAEEAKVAMRKVRQDFRNKLLKKCSEDEEKTMDKSIQQKLNEWIDKVEKTSKDKQLRL